jgi:hypothetical protein
VDDPQYRQALKAARPEDVPHGRTYLQAAIDVRTGDASEAVRKFRAIAGDPDCHAIEPRLGLAEALRRSGQPASAEEYLRALINDAPPRANEIFETWLALGFADLQWTPAEAARHLQSLEAKEESSPGGCVKNALWLTGELENTGFLRINCGGGEYASPTGVTWGEDRFAKGGRGGRWHPHAFGDEVAGTGGHSLYHERRSFREDGIDPGYRVPLPEGRYRVTLHFAESQYQVAGGRVFDIVVEGTVSKENFDPFAAAGYATAVRLTEEVLVTDGLLEIALRSRVGRPEIAAIEIESVSPRGR